MLSVFNRTVLGSKLPQETGSFPFLESAETTARDHLDWNPEAIFPTRMWVRGPQDLLSPTFHDSRLLSSLLLIPMSLKKKPLTCLSVSRVLYTTLGHSRLSSAF